MKIYDAENQILGRMSSVIAKELLKGEDIVVVNVERAVISGNPTATIKHYKVRVKRGDPHKGPLFPRTPEGIFRRAVRGMLPRKKAKGRTAYRRLKVFVGVPDRFKSKAEEFKKIKVADGRKLKTRSLQLGKLSFALGAEKR